MIIILSFLAGAALTLAVIIAKDEQEHRQYVRDWQREKHSCAIIRSRHRRSDRHREAPMPLDMYQVQLDTCGRARGVRINGRWR